MRQAMRPLYVDGIGVRIVSEFRLNHRQNARHLILQGIKPENADDDRTDQDRYDLPTCPNDPERPCRP